MEYTARLENWVKDDTHSVIWGFVYEDSKGRFRDGTWIHTSYIDADLFISAKEDDVVKTLNSSYLLGKQKNV